MSDSVEVVYSPATTALREAGYSIMRPVTAEEEAVNVW